MISAFFFLTFSFCMCQMKANVFKNDLKFEENGFVFDSVLVDLIVESVLFSNEASSLSELLVWCALGCVHMYT